MYHASNNEATKERVKKSDSKHYSTEKATQWKEIKNGEYGRNDT